MPKIINFKTCFCSYRLGNTFTENKSKILILASTLSNAGGPLLGLVICRPRDVPIWLNDVVNDDFKIGILIVDTLIQLHTGHDIVPRYSILQAQ